MSPLETIQYIIKEAKLGHGILKKERDYVIEWLNNTLFMPSDADIISDIQSLFPVEYGLHLDWDEARLLEQENGKSMDRFAKAVKDMLPEGTVIDDLREGDAEDWNDDEAEPDEKTNKVDDIVDAENGADEHELAIVYDWLKTGYDDMDAYHNSIAFKISEKFPNLWKQYDMWVDDQNDKRVEENITVEDAKQREEYYTKAQQDYKVNKERVDKMLNAHFAKKEVDKDGNVDHSNRKEYRFSEALVDIAYNAGHFGLTTGDSRRDVQMFKEWAYDFYMSWNYDDPNADYIEGIDNFYTQRAGKLALEMLQAKLFGHENTF